eukprot:scaffold25047_cov23-Tisochrysis_lutea.AAC.1
MKDTGAQLPSFTFNIAGSVDVDYNTVVADASSQRNFEEEVFHALTNGILSLDQEANTTFIQRSLDGTVIHVDVDRGSTSSTNVTANVTMSYPFFTQAKFDMFMVRVIAFGHSELEFKNCCCCGPLCKELATSERAESLFSSNVALKVGGCSVCTGCQGQAVDKVRQLPRSGSGQGQAVAKVRQLPRSGSGQGQAVAKVRQWTSETGCALALTSSKHLAYQRAHDDV